MKKICFAIKKKQQQRGEREEKISIIEKGEEEKSVFVAMEKLIYKYTFFFHLSEPQKIKNFIISILSRKKKWENFFF